MVPVPGVTAAPASWLAPTRTVYCAEARIVAEIALIVELWMSTVRGTVAFWQLSPRVLLGPPVTTACSSVIVAGEFDRLTAEVAVEPDRLPSTSTRTRSRVRWVPLAWLTPFCHEEPGPTLMMTSRSVVLEVSP